ncbi:MAG: lipopolysaccharide biosynthesis protein [Myxococcota bacterium]
MSEFEDRNRYLDTEHLQDDLGDRSLKGGLFQTIAQGAKSLVDLASTLVLARLLMPEDFGVLGMVIAVTGFLAMFKDMGLTMATVQREDIEHPQVNTLFWVNVGVSIVLMLLTIGLAPVLSWFYDDPRLVPITLILAGTFLFNGLTVQHDAILRRQMRFGIVAWIETLAVAISVVVAIVMATMDFGYWSLVAKQVVTTFVAMAGVWIACGWRPTRPTWADKAGELVAFGGNLTGHSVLNYFSAHLDDVLIGRFFGASPLGLFQKAHDVMRLPLSQINAPIGSVAVPMLSRIHGNDERYKHTYLRVLEKIMMLTMPLGALMIGTSDWIIPAVLGDKWVDASIIFAALGIGMFTKPVSNTTGWLFISQDRTDEMMRWGFVGSTLSVASFVAGLAVGLHYASEFAGLPFGVLCVAAFYSVSGVFVRTPILLWWVGRDGPIQARDIYKRSIPFIVSAFTVGAALYAFRLLVDIENVFIGIGIALLLTIVTTLLTLIIFPGGRAAMGDVKTLAKKLKSEAGEDDEDERGPSDATPRPDGDTEDD